MTQKWMQDLIPFSSVLSEHILSATRDSCSPGPGGDIGNQAEEIPEVYPGLQMFSGGLQSEELK